MVGQLFRRHMMIRWPKSPRGRFRYPSESVALLRLPLQQKGRQNGWALWQGKSREKPVGLASQANCRNILPRIVALLSGKPARTSSPGSAILPATPPKASGPGQPIRSVAAESRPWREAPRTPHRDLRDSLSLAPLGERGPQPAFPPAGAGRGPHVLLVVGVRGAHPAPNVAAG